jgi:hypothetical protein
MVLDNVTERIIENVFIVEQVDIMSQSTRVSFIVVIESVRTECRLLCGHITAGKSTI